MNLFRSFLFCMSAPFLLLTACHDGNEGKEGAANDSIVNVGDSLSRDSDALVIALTPTVDCLPVYYAKQSGIFQTLGLKVNVLTYRSQFDCDTAMLGATAMGGATDLVRLHYYADKRQPLAAVTSTDGNWKLLACGKLRIKKTALLKERMISIARFSASDYFSKVALDAARMDYSDVFRPQINDVYLRTSMLNNNQIDAAMLPEPLATKARLAGHRVLYATTEKSENMGCLAFKPSFLAEKDSLNRVKLLLQGYNQAVDEINQKGKIACVDILLKQYELAPQVVDSLSLPKYEKATLPDHATMAKAQQFLKMHDHWREGINISTLLNGNFLPK